MLVARKAVLIYASPLAIYRCSFFIGCRRAAVVWSGGTKRFAGFPLHQLGRLQRSVVAHQGGLRGRAGHEGGDGGGDQWNAGVDRSARELFERRSVQTIFEE